ncbi:chloride channel protein [Microseira wollei]|uniref:Chloride channel protein n=1 Tax=Microseira wollei NIES-4236 TaxID=2530354 RepID=A0AAV3X3M4_9CYAN|nr:chloride channel protein [Microseira wollei]GET36848.1 chloride channel protein [Microseira wollei NIES-4236]
MSYLPPAAASLSESTALRTGTSCRVPTSTSRLTRLLNHLQPSPETMVLILAVLIGGGSGMGVVTFHYLIERIHSLMLEDLMGHISVWGSWSLACVPTIGGLLIGLMRWRLQDFGPSISTLIAATEDAKLALSRELRPVTKMVAAAISLGTGASLGPEGPSVEIGANFGMLVGQVLQVSRERHRLLLGAGAAAGLAAGFNAPIAGVFFALELVLGTTFATSAVSVVLLAAVVAALVAQIGLGAQPAFSLPAYDVRSPLELPLYMGLGLLASLVSLTYTQAIQLAQRCFRGQVAGFGWLGRIPRYIHPVIGGLGVGLVGLQLPQILGIGYETVGAMLQDVKFSLQLLLLLLVVKLVMTAFSLGSGLVGGVFAPAMFLGASLGAAYGKILPLLLPGLSLHIAAPPAYAMVGMAAVLAASVRAPLTAILLLFEMTRDYRIVLPLMAAVGLSVWLLDTIKSKSTVNKGLNLQQMGVNVEKDQNLELLKQIPVSAAMLKPRLMLSSSCSVLEAGLAMTNERCHTALAIDQDLKLIGLVTLQDIDRAIAASESDASTINLVDLTLAAICTKDLLYAYADEPVADALDRMAARGLHQLPVVERDNLKRILGLLEKEGITLACDVAVTTRAINRYLSPPALTTQELPLPKLTQTA